MSDAKSAAGPATGVLPGKATPRGKYSHVKRAGDFLYVSGIRDRKSVV